MKRYILEADHKYYKDTDFTTRKVIFTKDITEACMFEHYSNAEYTANNIDIKLKIIPVTQK